jgi:transposase-like protein
VGCATRRFRSPTACTRPAGARSSAWTSGEAETEAFWRAFLRSLRARGLDGVQLVISDAHTGLKTAIAKVFGCPWQRCTVHFLRDMLGHVTRAQQPLVSGAIRQIFTAASAAEARDRLGQVADQLRPHAPKVARLLEDAEADLLAFYGFPAEHWSKLRSTDESFKALVALPAGPGAVRLGVGRGRPGAKSRVLGLEALPRSFAPLRA